MAADRQIHKELKYIPPEYFPIWNETLGYQRGLPQFQQPPEFSEEGVLTPTAGELTYEQRRRLVAPPMPASSLTGQIELEVGSPPMAPPPSPNEYIINDPAPQWAWQQTTWAPAQPAAEPTTSLPEEHNAFGEDPYNHMYGDPAEQLAMEEAYGTDIWH
ncbi:hypothetical protein JOM56_008942 [Amanita muscaria]